MWVIFSVLASPFRPNVRAVTPSMKISPVIRIGIPVLLALVLMYVAFRSVDTRSLLANLAGANLGVLLLSTGIGLLAFVVRAHRWALLLEPLGERPGLGRATASLMIGYLANLAFPRLGEVTRCAAMVKGGRLSFDRVLGTVIVERVVDLLSLVACIFLALAVEKDRISGFLHEHIVEPLGEKFSAGKVLGVLAILVILATLLFSWASRRHESKGWAGRISGFIRGIGAGVSSILGLRSPGWFLFDSILIWLLYYLGVYICFYALPQTTDLDWSAGLVVLVIGGLGMAAPVQGGFGAYHLLVAGGLGLFGLTYEDGLAFATLVHSLGLIQVLVLGTLSVYFLGRFSRVIQQ